MRRAARKDANHREVIRAFERLGCSVMDVSAVDCGCDLVIGYGGISVLVEVKDGRLPPSRRTLTDLEVKRQETWRGGYYVIENLDGVVDLATELTLRTR